MKGMGGGQGFTLIELIFFMVIVSVAVAGMVPLVQQVFANLQLATDMGQGYFLVQGILEQIDARLAGGGETLENIVEDFKLHGCTKPDGTSWMQGFPWRCQIGGEATYGFVTITIVWTDTNGVVFSDGDFFPRQGYR